MAFDTTTGAALLKTHYTKERLAEMVYKENALLGLTKKKTDFGGDSLKVPYIYANPQAGSADFTTALNASTGASTQSAVQVITRKKEYAFATISREAIKATKNDEDAFIQAFTAENDGAINVVKRALAVAQYRQGWGEVGVIGSISSATITLATLSDVCNFEKGMVICFSASVASNTLRNTGGTTTLTVNAVDRSNGTITCSANISTITGTTTNDVIFRNGDRQDSATPTRRKIIGLPGHLPFTAPTSGDSFNGVDRSVDVVRLAGGRLDASSLPIEEALIESAMRVGREGQRVTHFFMSFKYLSALDKALTGKVTYMELKNGQVGFDAMKVVGPRGTVMVVGDQNCPDTNLFGLNLDYWWLHSLDDLVSAVDEDGLDMIRQSSSDGFEIRWTSLCDMYTNCPAANINVKTAG